MNFNRYFVFINKFNKSYQLFIVDFSAILSKQKALVPNWNQGFSFKI